MVGQRYWRAVKVCLFVPLIARVAISTAVSGKGATPSSVKESVCSTGTYSRARDTGESFMYFCVCHL